MQPTAAVEPQSIYRARPLRPLPIDVAALAALASTGWRERAGRQKIATWQTYDRENRVADALQPVETARQSSSTQSARSARRNSDPTLSELGAAGSLWWILVRACLAPATFSSPGPAAAAANPPRRYHSGSARLGLVRPNRRETLDLQRLGLIMRASKYCGARRRRSDHSSGHGGVLGRSVKQRLGLSRGCDAP